MKTKYMSKKKRKGNVIQNKKTNPPNNKIKNWMAIPKTIRMILGKAPIIREKILEIKALKNSPTSKAFGYLHLYRLQGENKVLKRRETEKKLAPNQITFSHAENKNFGIS